MCVGKFVSPLTCDFETEADSSIRRGALSDDGSRVILSSGAHLRVLKSPSLDVEAAGEEMLNDELTDAASAFFGPDQTVCMVTVDPGGLQEESWTALECLDEEGTLEFGERFDSAGLLMSDVPYEGHFVVAAVTMTRCIF